MEGVSNDFMEAVVSGTVGEYNERQAAASEEGGNGQSNQEQVTSSLYTTNNGGQSASAEENDGAENNGKSSEENKNNTEGNGQQAEPSFDENGFITTISGGLFSTKEELSAFIGKREQYTGLESKLSELERENQSLKDNTPKFANDYISKLNSLVASGASDSQISAFNMLNKAGDLKSLEPFEIRKMALVLQNGISSEEAEIYLKSKYSLDEELHDAVDLQNSKVNLKIDAVADLQYLEQHLAKVSEAPAVEKPKSQEQLQDEFKQKEEAYLKVATPHLNQMIEGFSAVKGVNVNGKTGEDAVVMDMPVSDATKAQLTQAVQGFAFQNNIDVNSVEGKQALETWMTNVAKIMDYENNIMHAYNSGVKSMAEKFHNPSNINRAEDRNVRSANDLDKAMAFVVNNS
ncbi:hypothetical protein [Sphingobacterium detergens]|uniref:hypothetical protein n=1 Tax=Sphingobacterium detergens TaxID=1145106 RepID=UPI003AAF95BB